MIYIRSFLFSSIAIFLSFSEFLIAKETKKDLMDFTKCYIDLCNERIECLFPKKANRGIFNNHFYLCTQFSCTDFLYLLVPKDPLLKLDLESLINWVDLPYDIEKYGIHPLKKLPPNFIKGYEIDCRHEVIYAYFPDTEELGRIYSIDDAPSEAEIYIKTEGNRYIILCSQTRPILLISTVALNDALEKLLESITISFK